MRKKDQERAQVKIYAMYKVLFNCWW